MLAATASVGINCTQTASTPQDPCALPEATIVRRAGTAVLLTWDLENDPRWFSAPASGNRGFEEFLAAIRAAGSDVARPAPDSQWVVDEATRALWRDEAFNVDRMFDGTGEVGPARCLDAALFTMQHDRYSQLTHPTEFVAHVLRRGDRLRVYFGASDAMFPPREFDGLAEVKAAVGDGWEYVAVLHNHPVRRMNGRPVLGMPAPSTSDVQLFRNLANDLGLREVWVTNGVYTGVVPAANLSRLRARE